MKTMTKKRGFTIVELVIVIAVIAILAAVLIPTFTGIIRKAKRTADQTAVAQMNTILKADGAVTPTSILNLFDVLSAEGIQAEDYTPLMKDHFFFWDSVNNAIVYVDEEYNVLYPEDMKDSNKANWVSLNGKIGDADLDAFENKATVDVTTPEQLVALITAISEGNKDFDDVTTINLSNTTYNVMGAEFQIDTLGKALTINGNNAKIVGIVNNAAARENQKSASGTDRDYHAGIIAEVRKDLTIENLTIEGATIGGNGISQVGVVGAIYGGATVKMNNVDIKDTTFVGVQKVGTFVGYMAVQSNNAPTLIIDADCSAENVTVQAVAGLNGGIFGALDKTGTTVKVAEAAMANINVTVEQKEIGSANYLTVGDVKYGIDRNPDLTPFKGKIKVDGVDGYLKYYRANAKYGFTIGANTAITDANGQVLGLDGIKAASRSGAVDVALPAVTAGYYVFAK